MKPSNPYQKEYEELFAQYRGEGRTLNPNYELENLYEKVQLWDEAFKVGVEWEESIKCYCCSQSGHCETGCGCWEGCEVNEGFDEDNYDEETGYQIQLPCEYEKGHRGRHLHFLIYKRPGEEKSIGWATHPIFWGEEE